MEEGNPKAIFALLLIISIFVLTFLFINTLQESTITGKYIDNSNNRVLLIVFIITVLILIALLIILLIGIRRALAEDYEG